jgi:uncharacterized protein (DUF58 family)
MTTRGRFAVSGTGAACLVAAMVAYLLVLATGDGWLLSVVAAGLTLPLVDLAFACRAGGLTLRLPTRAVAGQTVPVRVERTGRWAPETDLVATLFPPSGAVRARVHAGCDATVTAVPAGDRGPLPPLRWMADTYGPLGLTARRRHGTHGTAVLVHPAPADPLPAVLGGLAPGGSAVARSGEEQIPAGVRAFRPGDGARTVHWRSTARRSIPIVRSHTAEQGRGLVVAAGRIANADEEQLARVAATVLAAQARGVPVSLLSGGGVARPATATAALDWFALLTSGSPPHVPAGPVLWVGTGGRPTRPG